MSEPASPLDRVTASSGDDVALPEAALERIEQEEMPATETFVAPGTVAEPGEITVEGAGGLDVSVTPDAIAMTDGHLDISALAKLPPDPPEDALPSVS